MKGWVKKVTIERDSNIAGSVGRNEGLGEICRMVTSQGVLVGTKGWVRYVTLTGMATSHGVLVGMKGWVMGETLDGMVTSQ